MKSLNCLVKLDGYPLSNIHLNITATVTNKSVYAHSVVREAVDAYLAQHQLSPFCTFGEFQIFLNNSRLDIARLYQPSEEGWYGGYFPGSTLSCRAFEDIGEALTNDFLTIQLCGRLCGGKGGFGTLLRGQRGPKRKTQNFDACRDLEGNRLGSLKNKSEQIARWREKKIEEEKFVEALGGEDAEREALKRAQPDSAARFPHRFRRDENSAALRYLKTARVMSEEVAAAVAASSSMSRSVEDPATNGKRSMSSPCLLDPRELLGDTDKSSGEDSDGDSSDNNECSTNSDGRYACAENEVYDKHISMHQNVDKMENQ